MRVFFRASFLLLALATLALALSVLVEQKQLSYRDYGDLFAKSVAQITARLQHPAGQLALINPAAGAAGSGLRPYVLPFAGLDFDDRTKVQQAVEMAGCRLRYPGEADLCVAVGNSPAAGGFLYAVGSFVSGPLVEHALGDLDLDGAHRLRVEVSLRGRTYRWLAPLEAAARRHGIAVQGRLTGFAEGDDGRRARRPERDFRGWLWQESRCLDADLQAPPPPLPCRRRSFYSVRLPIELFREDLLERDRVVWPPPDLGDVRVHVEVLGPGEGEALFDSDTAGATAPFALPDLRRELLDGETLSIRRLHPRPADVLVLTNGSEAPRTPSLVRSLIARLPATGSDAPLRATQTIATPAGDYEITLEGDRQGVDRSLGVVVARLAWYVGAMLAAILLTWLAIEVRIIRRITLLTTRAAAVRKSVHGAEGLIEHDLASLRGRDELGLLAGVLADLLQRVNEDVKREQIRADQEKDMWHAVGHEIRAPLQSLLALHPAPEDPSRRYIERMQQAVRVLYGRAPPSEAILSASLSLATLDLRAFLRHVAANAADAGIPDVHFEDEGGALAVRADEHSLEDVLTHVLGNAARYRRPGSPIRLGLRESAGGAEVVVHNEGPHIDAQLLGRIFEYGVTDGLQDGHRGRGQGLFVAKTYMAKMGGTIEARNVADGVEIVLALARA
ncbi:MAG: HAMP domain-containing histidine kinase [Proteobacteria bacterium]|nr:HAMP domain-containing histidine kinase [Pseudomonadota bacterium]